MALSKESEEKIQKLQLIEQSLQNLLLQKQNFQTQLIEIDSALEELKNRRSAYKIIGNIMVVTHSENLQKELNEKKSMVNLRIKNLEKQEEQIKGKAKKIQADVLEEMKETKGWENGTKRND